MTREVDQRHCISSLALEPHPVGASGMLAELKRRYAQGWKKNISDFPRFGPSEQFNLESVYQYWRKHHSMLPSLPHIPIYLSASVEEKPCSCVKWFGETDFGYRCSSTILLDQYHLQRPGFLTCKRCSHGLVIQHFFFLDDLENARKLRSSSSCDSPTLSSSSFSHNSPASNNNSNDFGWDKSYLMHQHFDFVSRRLKSSLSDLTKDVLLKLFGLVTGSGVPGNWMYPTFFLRKKNSKLMELDSKEYLTLSRPTVLFIRHAALSALCSCEALARVRPKYTIILCPTTATEFRDSKLCVSEWWVAIQLPAHFTLSIDFHSTELLDDGELTLLGVLDGSLSPDEFPNAELAAANGAAYVEERTQVHFFRLPRLRTTLSTALEPVSVQALNLSTGIDITTHATDVLQLDTFGSFIEFVDDLVSYRLIERNGQKLIMPFWKPSGGPGIVFERDGRYVIMFSFDHIYNVHYIRFVSDALIFRRIPLIPSDMTGCLRNMENPAQKQEELCKILGRKCGVYLPPLDVLLHQDSNNNNNNNNNKIFT